MCAEETDPLEGIAPWVLMSSRALYVTSFFLPAVMNDPHHTFPGYQAFLGSLIGPLLYSVILLVNRQPMGFILLLALCPWLANVAYWIAVRRLCDGHRRGVVAPTVLAVSLGLSAFACYLVGLTLLPDHGRGAPSDFPFREGYWLWLGSMALPAFAGRGRGGNRRSKATIVKLAQCWDD